VKIFTDRKGVMGTQIPEPTIERLCRVFRLLRKISAEGITNISSGAIEKETGIPAHTVRKDISQIGSIKSGKEGYEAEGLLNLIGETFEFNIPRKACIVGLDIMESTILNNTQILNAGYEIVAGFDSNINRMEMMETEVPLFPTYEIENKVKELSIDFGIIAVAPEKAKDTAEKLIKGGIKGIINFSPVILNFKNNIIVRNIYLVEEIRLLSAMIATADKQKGEKNEESL
jgi:redox-sensing transcriptional repressor